MNATLLIITLTSTVSSVLNHATWISYGVVVFEVGYPVTISRILAFEMARIAEKNAKNEISILHVGKLSFGMLLRIDDKPHKTCIVMSCW